MGVKELIKIGDPLLKEICGDVNFFYDDTKKLIRDLADTLHHCQKKYKIGRAIAAPQIGILKKAVYMETEKETIIMFNPEIIRKSDEMFDVWDSCFSADVSFFRLIPRHRMIKVSYQDENGNRVERKFVDDLSELFQHEIDHLNGILFTDYESEEKVISREEWESLRVK